MSQSLERIANMDAKMQNLENAKVILENFLQELSKIRENYTELQKYYYENWMQDLEENPDAQYGILSEDGLYNLFFDIDE